jgi:hypothetical protein
MTQTVKAIAVWRSIRRWAASSWLLLLRGDHDLNEIKAQQGAWPGRRLPLRQRRGDRRSFRLQVPGYIGAGQLQ